MPKNTSLLGAPGSNFGLGRVQPTRQQGLAQLGLLADLSPAGDVMAMGQGVLNRDPLGFGLGAASLLLPGTIKPEAVSRFGKLAVKKIKALDFNQQLNFFDEIKLPGNPEKFMKSAGLRIDNPGGRWLEDEVARATKLDKFEGLRHGSVTANIKTEMSVDDLLPVRGMRGEQGRIRKANVDKLTKSIKEKGFDPDAPIFVNVGHDGTSLINEGNHRVRAAKAAGLKTVPVEISYFAGGEEAAGRFSKKSLSRKIFNAVIESK